MGDSRTDRAAVSAPCRLESSSHYKWLLVLALFFVSTLNYADRTAITALYTLLKTDLGFTDVGLGGLGSMFLWTYAFSSPFSGFLGDRVRRGRLVLWSLAGWSLVTLLTGLAATQWQLLGMRGALGLVEAMYLPAAMALVAEYHGPETRGTALALMALGNYMGMAGGGAVAGYFGEHYGWRVPLIGARRRRSGIGGNLQVYSAGGTGRASEKTRRRRFRFPRRRRLCSHSFVPGACRRGRVDGDRHVDFYQLAAPVLPREHGDDAGERGLLRLVARESERSGGAGGGRCGV